MANETVEINVQDDSVVPQPVDNSVVRVFDVTGTTLITEGTTGGVTPGNVEFTLPGTAAPTPTRYQLRFYINGGAILSPQYIDVYSPPSGSPTGTNRFLITASLFTLPVATNPRLCRASGCIWGPDGEPIKGIDIFFVAQFRPLVVDGYGVLGERVDTRTDKNGYVQVDLFRNGIYQATVESHENVERCVVVPDRSSINIMHLLFPIVVKAEMDPAGPYALAVGADLDITPTITASSFQVLKGAAVDDVSYTIDDPAIAAVTIQADHITIHGSAPGTTHLRIARKDNSILYVPDPGIDGYLLPIVVT